MFAFAIALCEEGKKNLTRNQKNSENVWQVRAGIHTKILMWRIFQAEKAAIKKLSWCVKNSWGSIDQSQNCSGRAH